MTDQDKITLAEVIAKVKQIAKDDYKGEVYDNILSVFNKLTVREKRTLLKGLINICFVVEDSVLLKNRELADVTTVVQNTISEELKELERLDKKSRIYLRDWFVKFIAVGLATFAGLFLLISWFINPAESTMFTKLADKYDGVVKILQIIFP